MAIPNGDTKFGNILPRTPIIVDQSNPSKQYFQYNGELIPVQANAFNSGLVHAPISNNIEYQCVH